ncbi:MAG: TonB-dependent receptor [Acidobacteriota bacterium]|nr:TonB-dependent receptor [Acidobacteriota bacterium]
MRIVQSIKSARMVTLAALIIAVLCVPAFAQQGYGSIGGTVQDPSGASVPNASITVTNMATGIASRLASLSDGNYLAPQLTPGNYQLAVEASGFKKYVSDGIVVHVADRLVLNIPLQLGSSAETVTVTGETSPLRTEDAQTGEVVNNNFIMNLPQIDRNPFALLRIAGNVQGAENGINPNSKSEVRINGGRTQSVDYFVDGAVVTTGRSHELSNQTPSIDAVQEFKVVTSGISAEYGRISGGYVQLVTKSGGNSFHGDAYEYMYNDMFDANSWYQNAVGNPKVHFRQNDFGFTLGGPVWIPKIYNGKNKTFFFVDNEYLKYNQASNIVIMSVPTQAERSGDLSQSMAAGIPTLMYDPNGPQSSTPNADGTYSRLGLLGGDGKHVPASEISPTSAAILALLPLPNRPSVAGYSSLNNYGAPQSTLQNNFRMGVRLDQVITDNQRLEIHYTTFSSDNSQSRVGGPLFTTATTQTNGGLNGTVNYDWTAKPTLLFNFRAAIVHNPLLTGNSLDPSFNSSTIHLNPAFQQILGTNAIPNIQEDFQTAGYYGRSPTANITVSTTYDFAFTGTKVLNRHVLKFGVEHRRYYDNFQNFGGSNTTTFMGNPVAATTGDHGFGATSSIPNSLGSFLLGIDNWNTVAGPSTRAMDVNYNAAFVQDDFKVTPKLTLNLGVRWDREGPTTERHDKIYFWDPTAAPLFSINPGYSWTGALAAAGLPTNIPAPSWVNGMPNGAVELPNTPGFPSRTFQGVDSHQFAPRLGVAYQLNDKTVLRASGGLMYIPTTATREDMPAAMKAFLWGMRGMRVGTLRMTVGGTIFQRGRTRFRCPARSLRIRATPSLLTRKAPKIPAWARSTKTCTCRASTRGWQACSGSFRLVS